MISLSQYPSFHNVIRDLLSDGTTVEYLNGLGVDDKVRQSSAAGTFYFTHDHLGSTTALTDASGNVVERITYDAFGNTVGSTRTRYTYTGRKWDADANLYYYRARWYDSHAGRFISEDPIGFKGGDVNFYGYVLNNPVRYNDPSGKWAHIVIGAGIGGASNAFFYYVEQKIRGCEIETSDFLRAAAGAISGGLSAAVPGLGSFGGFFNGFHGGIRGGMLFDGVGQFAANVGFRLAGQDMDLRDGIDNAMFGGGVGGGIGGGLGKFMDELAPNPRAVFDGMTGMFGDGSGTAVNLAEKGCGCD